MCVNNKKIYSIIGNIHKNQSTTSFFNMASHNINNNIKSSLEFVHRGTVVFLRYFGPFSNQRPFQNLHTRVYNRTGLCLQKRPHTEVHGVQIWKWRRSHMAPELREMTGTPLEVFWCVRRWSLLDLWLLCVVFVGEKDLFFCTHECGGFDTDEMYLQQQL